MVGAYCNQALSVSTLTQQRKGRYMAKAHIKRLQRQAARVTELNARIDSGDHAARKVKKMMQGSWVKRQSTNVYGFFDQKKARAIKRGEA